MKNFKLLLIAIALLFTNIASANTKIITIDPVEFKAALYSGDLNQIILQWRTTLEVAQPNFDIERLDANGVWQRIGTVSSGNTNGNITNFQFIDATPLKGMNTYRLRRNEIEGSTYYSQQVAVEMRKMTNGNNSFQNYPNPFDNSTTIRYEVLTTGTVRLLIFDFNGKQIAQLVNSLQTPGNYQVKWDGLGFPPGTYIYKVITNDDMVTRQMIKAR